MLYLVHADINGIWIARKYRSPRASKRFKTKREAIEWARQRTPRSEYVYFHKSKNNFLFTAIKGKKKNGTKRTPK